MNRADAIVEQLVKVEVEIAVLKKLLLEVSNLLTRDRKPIRDECLVHHARYLLSLYDKLNEQLPSTKEQTDEHKTIK